MKFRLFLLAICSGIFLAISLSASAAGFWRTGSIERVLTDRQFGGCMILLSTPIGYPCTESGWVSLDCERKYGDFSREMYTAALTAFSMNKRVSVYVLDHERHGAYCVAKRLDVMK